MDIQDYNSKLSSIQREYRKARDRADKRHEESINKLEEKNKRLQRTKTKRFSHEKDRLEQEIENTEKNYKAYARKEIRDRQDKNRERMIEQKEEYDTEASKSKKKFRNSLSDITTEYRDLGKARERFYDGVRTEAKKRYQNSLTNTLDKHNKETKQANKAVSKSNRAFIEDTLADRRKMMRNHRQERRGIIESASKQRNELKQKLRGEIDQIKKTYDQEIKNRAENYQNILSRRTEQHEENSKNLQKTFEKRAENINRMADKRIELIQNESSDPGDVDSGKKKINQRLEKLNAKLYEQKKRSESQHEMLIDGFKQELETVNLQARAEVKQKDKEINRIQREVVGGLKNKHTKEVDAYRQSIQQKMSQADTTISSLERSKKMATSNLHLKYGEQINNLQDNQMEALDQIRKEKNQEKTNFLNQVRAEFRQEQIQMKKKI